MLVSRRLHHPDLEALQLTAGPMDRMHIFRWAARRSRLQAPPNWAELPWP